MVLFEEEAEALSCVVGLQREDYGSFSVEGPGARDGPPSKKDTAH